MDYGFITSRQRSCGKVLFSVVSVCLFMGGWELDPYTGPMASPCTGPRPGLSITGPRLRCFYRPQAPAPKTFSNLFNLGHTEQGPRKWVVGIQLKCLFVDHTSGIWCLNWTKKGTRAKKGNNSQEESI